MSLENIVFHEDFPKPYTLKRKIQNVNNFMWVATAVRRAGSCG